MIKVKQRQLKVKGEHVLVQAKSGRLLKCTPSNVTRIDTRKQMNSVRSMHPNAIFLSELGKNLNVDDCYKELDDNRSVYYIIRMLMITHTPSALERFKAWLKG